MISQITLHNIKSHLDTTLNLAPGLNVIGGESDEGKSNIFRAVTWALFSKPLGWNPKPWDRLKPVGKESWVEIVFADGNVVKRVRTFAGKNWYELNGEKLEGLRGKVPEQVEEVVNMNDSNMQQQKDMFFLLDDTAGSVAKEINKVFDLSKMDTGLTNAKSRMKAAEDLQKEAERLISEKQAQIDSLAWAEVADRELIGLQARETKWQQQTWEFQAVVGNVEVSRLLSRELSAFPEFLEMDYAGLKEDMNRLQEAKDNLERTKRAVEVTKHIGLALAETIPNVDMVITSLDSIREDHQHFGEMVKKAEECVDAIKGFKLIRGVLVDSMPDECVVALDDLASRLESLNKARINQMNVEGFIKNQQELVGRIAEADAKIHSDSDALQTLRANMEVCPTCLTELKKE